MPQIQTKILSSLEKCFWDEDITKKKEVSEFLMFQNEKLSFQIGFINTEPKKSLPLKVKLDGSFAPYATIREVVSVPCMFPYAPDRVDEDYLRYTPGMYPDLLRPLHYGGAVPAPYGQLRALWVDIRLPEDFSPTNEPYDLTVSLHDWTTEEELGSVHATVHVVQPKLPPQKLIHTEWFYTDCLANYYHTEAFSERHWQIIEKFLRTAADNGINMILTPVFTPELDTYIGGERLTTQLAEITVDEKGSYHFDFSAVERWIDLCLSLGIQYFEIPHFFTQWGALHAPKIIANVCGETKQIFGWETDALGDAYADFLSALIPALLGVLKKKGVDKHTYFHVSDEPKLPDLEHYSRCRALIGQYLEGYPIIDALSEYAFYETGALPKPVPAIKAAEPFLENKVEGLWVYYCGANGCVETTNRFLAMSLARCRILGVQLYLNRIEGFLHWGYNFYNNWCSYEAIDPFGSSDGEFFGVSGDMYLVYPGTEGEAWESMRLNALREAMDDMRALTLCESLYGREFTERLILENTDGILTFKHYPKTADYLLSLREKVAKAIEAKQ